jgi:predicted component of type VI protein secretion system
MSFPALSKKEKEDSLQKCFYMMNLIRNKNVDLWEMYQPIYATLNSDESWEFYHLLMEEYQRLLEAPAVKKTAKKRKNAKK